MFRRTLVERRVQAGRCRYAMPLHGADDPQRQRGHQRPDQRGRDDHPAARQRSQRDRRCVALEHHAEHRKEIDDTRRRRDHADPDTEHDEAIGEAQASRVVVAELACAGIEHERGDRKEGGQGDGVHQHAAACVELEEVEHRGVLPRAMVSRARATLRVRDDFSTPTRACRTRGRGSARSRRSCRRACSRGDARACGPRTRTRAGPGRESRGPSG